MKNKKESLKYEDIVKVRIPNEEVGPWMQTLREGGFTDKEIDEFLSRMNANYKKAKNPHFIEEELSKIRRHFLKDYHRILTLEEIKYLKKGIASRLEDPQPQEETSSSDTILEARVPDEDVSGWTKSLKDGGFTKEEINRIMSGLNKRYRKEHNPNIVEEEIENLKVIFRKKHNRELTPEEIEEWRKSLEILEGDDEDDD